MEKLLHYVWKHKMYPLGDLYTTAGKSIEVIDPGLHNQNAGPDFFNAKIKINGTLWVGNVEIHIKSSDWYVHGHQNDDRYDNVILHVASVIDKEVITKDGKTLDQMELQVPSGVKEHYEELITTDSYPPCYKVIPDLSSLTVHSWMSALQTERLEQKTNAIEQRVNRCNGSWESAYFVTLARNYGFGINGDAFERWAYNIPLSLVARHNDNIFQVEALFMGQAGLLDLSAIPARYQTAALNDGYFSKLAKEYSYLAHKFNLKPMSYVQWNYLRLRPQNFPHIRISQLVNLYHEGRTGLNKLIECADTVDIVKLFKTHVTEYWTTHYMFGSESSHNDKFLSPFSANLLIINTAVPILFAYGRHIMRDDLADRAFELLDQLKAENNYIIRMWKQCGLEVQNAGDSQALIQLKKMYCDRKDCLRCRIGYEYLKMKR